MIRATALAFAIILASLPPARADITADVHESAGMFLATADDLARTIRDCPSEAATTARGHYVTSIVPLRNQVQQLTEMMWPKVDASVELVMRDGISKVDMLTVLMETSIATLRKNCPTPVPTPRRKPAQSSVYSTDEILRGSN